MTTGQLKTTMSAEIALSSAVDALRAMAVSPSFRLLDGATALKIAADALERGLDAFAASRSVR